MKLREKTLFFCLSFFLMFVTAPELRGEENKDLQGTQTPTDAQAPKSEQAPCSVGICDYSPLSASNINNMKNLIVEKSESYAFLVGFATFKKKDLSMCDKISFSEKARTIAERSIEANDLINGNWQNIKDPALQRISRSISIKDGSMLTGWEADMYNGIVGCNEALLHKGMLTIRSGIEDKDEIRNETHVLAAACIYNKYGKKAALKYTTNTQYELVVNILFSKEDPEIVLEKILNDMILFEISKGKGDPAICGKINDSFIKGKCLNPHYKNMYVREKSDTEKNAEKVQ